VDIDEMKEARMKAKATVKAWNELRVQIIQAQVAPALVLIGVFAVAAFGGFENATDGAKYLAVGVAAATGILAIISQYAAVREAEALLIDMKNAEEPTALSKKIAESRGLLSLSAIAIVGLGIAIFALVVWAVLG
jgi:multisubunit Na+/H+ antiporter MnhB subunit